MKVFCKTSNGDQIQVTLEGDMNKIFQFIEDYKGDDLGNDLILQDFVDDFEETGVIIYAD
ncbi:hypothetical protein EP331_00200 [bacterium]|nr:MAG: hypothetical protein EP331_00200 [bacterium]